MPSFPAHPALCRLAALEVGRLYTGSEYGRSFYYSSVPLLLPALWPVLCQGCRTSGVSMHPCWPLYIYNEGSFHNSSLLDVHQYVHHISSLPLLPVVPLADPFHTSCFGSAVAPLIRAYASAGLPPQLAEFPPGVSAPVRCAHRCSLSVSIV